MLAGDANRSRGWLAVGCWAFIFLSVVCGAPQNAQAQVDLQAPPQKQAEGDVETKTDASRATREPASNALPADNASDDATADEESSGAAGRAVPADGEGTLDRVALRNITIVLAIFAASIALGIYLSRWLRMPDHATRMILVAFAILAGTAATWFDWPPKLGIDLSGGVILVYEVEQQDFKDMDKLVGAVSRRVNPGGIKEVTVRPYGEREVEIIIPEAGQAELDRIQDRIRRQGQLEFRIVADERVDKAIMDVAREPAYENKEKVFLDSESPVLDAEGNRRADAKWVPVALAEAGRFRGQPNVAVRQRRGRTETLVLIDRYDVTGEYLSNATAGHDSRTGRPNVQFSFNTEGARKFGDLTGSNLPDPAQPDFKRELAIILDGELQSAPVINSRIDQNGEITGSFTQRDVEDLASVLTAGSLPTTLRKEPTSSMRTGATLGEDTIYKGKIAMIVSTVAVIAFMLVYYQFAGIVANLALLLNVLLIVAFMILFNAAFTMSGLAGLALTVGMAVDANVLIYERMREELARGATLRMAIRNGFDRATTTIVDANVTTLISAIVLYAIGTDQVKGFAVTLILGIVMNLFTAITFTRLLFDIAEKRRWVTRLRMMHLMESPNFDFIGKRYLAYTLSVLLIGAGLVGVWQRGRGLLDIDFTGGVSVELLFEKPQSVAEVRERVQDLPDVTVQDIHPRAEETDDTRFLIITSKSDIDENNPRPGEARTNIEWVENKLKAAFNDADHRLAYNRLTWSDVKSSGGAIAAHDDKKGSDAAKSDAADGPAADSKAAESNEPSTDATESDAAETDQPAEASPDSNPDAETPPTPPADDSQSLWLPGDDRLLAWADEEATKSGDDKTPAADEPAEAEEADATPGDDAERSDLPAAKKDATDVKTTSAPTDSDAKQEDRAAAKASPTGRSKTTLTFSEAIDHDTLVKLIGDALETTAHAQEDVAIDVTNEDYEEGSFKSFRDWDLKIGLAPGATRAVLEHIAQEVGREPVFPSSNKVGASVAGNTQSQATLALIASLVMIIVYVWIRFQQVSFGFSSVLALVHDVLVALGALALSYWLAKLPGMDWLLIEPFKINLPIIAAFLTIIGYSINDTIVIFDRIREVRGKSPDVSPELVNLCINQTLSRTLLTSLTVFIVVLILYIFGGQAIHGFAFTLVVGTISGTYSTVYIATPILIWMNQSKAGGKQATASALAVNAAAKR